MSVTLNTVGAALSKTGSVTLADCVESPYARTHAASGYLRVNPFQVANGNAPSEFVAPHVLGDWASYTQTALNVGTNLEVTVGYGKLTVSWVVPSGYVAAAYAVLTQKLVIRSMGASENTSLDTFTTPFSTTDVGDVATYTVSATVSEWFAIGVKCYFDDSVTVHELSSSGAYTYKAGQTPMLGASAGISSGAAVYSTAPVIDSIIQSTDPGTCLVGCTGCVDFTINLDMQGPSLGTIQEKIGAGSWATLDTGVPAGTASISRTNKDASVLYSYRIRYNDVSPDDWSNTGSITTECTLV